MKTYDITETFPTPIVADFEAFLTGVEAHGAYLTKAKLTLDRATLYALDAQMRTFRTDTHPRTDQEYYPLLDLFQRICMAARLHIAQPVKGNLRMVPTEAATLFRQLSLCEKYVALLEALWVDVDWSEITRSGGYGILSEHDFLLEFLVQLPAGERVNLRAAQRRGIYLDPDQHAALNVLSFFGLLACEGPSSETLQRLGYGKGRIVLEAVTMNEFGLPLLKALADQRPRYLWNMPSRREFGGADFPGQAWEEGREGLTEPEPFHKALLPLFPAGALTRGLPRSERQTKKGTFVFKVTLGGGLWRTIAMSGEDTLDELHLAIQKAFRFDNDHLFAFFMDGKPYSKTRYNDSRGQEPPFADDAVIGRLDLWLRQRFLYLFDFGDEWRFDVELVEIRDGPHKGRPKVLEAKGKNPKQYRSEDDE